MILEGFGYAKITILIIFNNTKTELISLSLCFNKVNY
jgi:hypothetical protein